jgi:hypothetical protein
MSKTTMDELRAMNLQDLAREIKVQTLLVEKLRIGVELRKEKDTAKLRRERRQLARMRTEWTRKTRASLQGSVRPTTVLKP